MTASNAQEYQRLYRQRPYVKAKAAERSKKYRQRPEVKARELERGRKRKDYHREYNKEYNKRPDVKMREAERKAMRDQQPDVIAKKAERLATKLANNTKRNILKLERAMLREYRHRPYIKALAADDKKEYLKKYQKSKKEYRDQIREWLYDIQQGKCNGCGSHWPNFGYFQLDHINPKDKKDGLSDRVVFKKNGFQLLCGTCNFVKSDNSQEWMLNKLRTDGIIK